MPEQADCRHLRLTRGGGPPAEIGCAAACSVPRLRLLVVLGSAANQVGGTMGKQDAVSLEVPVRWYHFWLTLLGAVLTVVALLQQRTAGAIALHAVFIAVGIWFCVRIARQYVRLDPDRIVVQDPYWKLTFDRSEISGVRVRAFPGPFAAAHICLTTPRGEKFLKPTIGVARSGRWSRRLEQQRQLIEEWLAGGSQGRHAA